MPAISTPHLGQQLLSQRVSPFPDTLLPPHTRPAPHMQDPRFHQPP